MRLTARPCAAHMLLLLLVLLLAAHKVALRQGIRVLFLGLLVQVLRSFSFLDHRDCLVVIVLLEKLLDARSLQLGLVLQHLF